MTYCAAYSVVQDEKILVVVRSLHLSLPHSQTVSHRGTQRVEFSSSLSCIVLFGSGRMHAQFATVNTSFALLPTASTVPLSASLSQSEAVQGEALLGFVASQGWWVELMRDKKLEKGHCIWRIPIMQYRGKLYRGVVATIRTTGLVQVLCPLCDVATATELTRCIRKKLSAMVYKEDEEQHASRLEETRMREYVQHGLQRPDGDASHHPPFQPETASSSVQMYSSTRNDDIEVMNFTAFLYPHIPYLFRLHRKVTFGDESEAEDGDAEGWGHAAGRKRQRSEWLPSRLHVNVRGDAAVRWMERLFSWHLDDERAEASRERYVNEKARTLHRYVASSQVVRLSRREGLQVILQWRTVPLVAGEPTQNVNRSLPLGHKGAMPAPALAPLSAPPSSAQIVTPVVPTAATPSTHSFLLEPSADVFFLESVMPMTAHSGDNSADTLAGASWGPASPITGEHVKTRGHCATNPHVHATKPIESINCIIYASGKAQMSAQSVASLQLFTELVLLPFILCNSDL